MKRSLCVMSLAALVLLGLMFVFLPSGGRTHAQTGSQSKKVSRDLVVNWFA